MDGSQFHDDDGDCSGVSMLLFSALLRFSCWYWCTGDSKSEDDAFVVVRSPAEDILDLDTDAVKRDCVSHILLRTEMPPHIKNAPAKNGRSTVLIVLGRFLDRGMVHLGKVDPIHAIETSH